MVVDLLAHRMVHNGTVLFRNPGTSPYHGCLVNAALPSASILNFISPKAKYHASRIETVIGNNKAQTRVKHQEMMGTTESRDANAFRAYTPSLGTSLYHIADETISPE
jgi:hypothetical protein